MHRLATILHVTDVDDDRQTDATLYQ